MSAFNDLAGRKFGRLTAVRRAPNKFGKVRWECACDCGETRIVSSGNLVTEQIRSCGCIKRESDQARFAKHYQSKTSTYGVWMRVRYRCNNVNSKDFKDYGGRGIRVCERWNSYENFLSDMGERPDGMSIDRIDNNGNYSPENCRWASNHVQVRNKRTNRWIELNGVNMTLQDWADHLNITAGALHYRLSKFPVDVALTMRKRGFK